MRLEEFDKKYSIVEKVFMNSEKVVSEWRLEFLKLIENGDLTKNDLDNYLEKKISEYEKTL